MTARPIGDEVTGYLSAWWRTPIAVDPSPAGASCCWSRSSVDCLQTYRRSKKKRDGEDGRHCREAEQLGSRKLATVRERMAQLRRVEKVLATLVDQCQCNSGKVRCPLIAALENHRPQLIGQKNS